MALGTPTPTFGYTPLPTETKGFFRARGISVSAPEDQDNDFMDDIWEITHSSYLDPLNPNDAFQVSLEPDHLPGENNLEYYRRKRGIVPLKEAIAREVSIFNFGQPTATGEAVSRTVSIFNGQSIPIFPGEVYSRETSVFNFGFNFGAPTAGVEAISRAVSVLNTAP